MTDRVVMMDNELAEIRARDNAGYMVYIEGFGEVQNVPAMKFDVAVLLAEVDRLRDEVTKWRDEYQDAICGDYDD